MVVRKWDPEGVSAVALTTGHRPGVSGKQIHIRPWSLGSGLPWRREGRHR